MDAPVSKDAGISQARERKWGIVGGLSGSAVGIGSGVVAVAFDGASWWQTGPFPDVFARKELLAIDVYLLLALVVGAGFSVAALISARISAYPRTECYGAGLLGALLTTLAGVIFFVRIIALVGGP